MAGPFGIRAWCNRSGALLLRRYSGTLNPRPYMPSAVGFALRPATTVSSTAGATYSNGNIYWHYVEKISGGGWVTETHPEHAKPTVWGGSGYVGAIPNTPSDVRVCQFGSDKVLVQWGYNPIWEQAAPASFDVFSDGGTGTMDWTTPVANVAFEDGEMAYGWVSGVLAAGAWRFNVRAKTSGGVYSLVPELRDKHVGSSSDYAPSGGINGTLMQLVSAVPTTPPAPEVG